MGIRKYNCNDNFFAVPDFESSYWAGFLAADGYISKNARFLELKLANKDRGHLEKFCQAIGFKGTMNRANSDATMVRIHSQKIVSDLRRIYNLHNKKSYDLSPPNISDPHVVFPFICGLIDGDGSIVFQNGYKNRCQYIGINLVGTKQLLEWISQYVNQYLAITKTKPSVKCPISTRYDPRIAYYHIVGVKAASLNAILKRFPNIPKMDRKWNKFNFTDVNGRKF